MTEREFTLACLKEAKRIGLRAHHCPDSRKCEGTRGCPDLILAGERGFLMPELKTEDGDLSASQQMWAYVLDKAGVYAPLLRPADLESGRITRLFGGIR